MNHYTCIERFILLLLSLCSSCTTIPTVEEELATFLATRSDEPLKGTIWEHQTVEEYNRYLYFSKADVSLFYGKTEAGELQRWSEFYTAPYDFQGGVVRTSLSFPLWGQTELTETATVVNGDGWTIDLDGDVYAYYGPYTEDIEGQWMLIFASINPWE